jgi:ferredoxin-NADP reductase
MRETEVAAPYRKPPIKWQAVTVVDLIEETPHTRTLTMQVESWPAHRAGQHVDLRLTAEDGYQTERSYSIASPPEQDTVSITVDRIDDGEVSPYLAGDLRIGDRFELRGPIGGYFGWSIDDGGPVFLAGGGSGVVPLMAMVRHRAAHSSTVDVRLLVSARSPDRLIYANELERRSAEANLDVAVTLTREQPPGWGGYARRVDAAMVDDLLLGRGPEHRAFVCGPNAFVEGTADLLLSAGVPTDAIHTERFGPTGT